LPKKCAKCGRPLKLSGKKGWVHKNGQIECTPLRSLEDTRVLAIGLIFVASVFVYCLYAIMNPPDHHLMVYEVFEVGHYNGNTSSGIWTIGQGKWGFNDYYPFEIGKAYSIVYRMTAASDKVYSSLRIVSVTELSPNPYQGQWKDMAMSQWLLSCREYYSNR